MFLFSRKLTLNHCDEAVTKQHLKGSVWTVAVTVGNSVDVDSSGSHVGADQQPHFFSLKENKSDFRTGGLAVKRASLGPGSLFSPFLP